MLRRKSPQFHRSSVSAESIFDNEDLLREILVRLPIRSILNFKSVSKRWCSLITSRSFSHHHGTISHPLTPSGIFFCPPRFLNSEPPYVFKFVDLSTNPSRAQTLDLTSHKSEILQSCNGLLLLCSSTTDFDYYIYNPTTNQFGSIPNLPAEEDGDKMITISMNLAFEPSRSSNYEVVCVLNLDYSQDKYQIKIYSSETGVWRRPNNPNLDVFKATSLMDFNSGVYCNRAIHWFNTSKNFLYFDLCEEKLHELARPRISSGRDKRRVEHFGYCCCGHLCLIKIKDWELHVWEIQDDYSGWIVKYHLDLQSCYAGYHPHLISDQRYMVSFPDISMLAMIDQSDDDDDNDPYLVLDLREEMVRLNLKSGTFERLGDMDGFMIQTYLFIESLAWV